MKKLNSTEPSTAELETKVRELLPLPHCNLAFDLFDELLKRRATDYATGERVRQIRTAKKEAMIEKAIEANAAMLRVTAPSRRASELLKRIDLKPDSYGLKKRLDGTYVSFDIDVVRRILRERGLLGQKPRL